MWTYDKKLQYPVNIKQTNPKLAMAIISQLGGPDGELAASLRYLNQRYSAPYDEVRAVLTDIGKEENYCAYIKTIKKGKVILPLVLYLLP